MFKIEVGKNYYNGRGEVISITSRHYNETYPFHDGKGNSYKEDGTHVSWRGSSDLVKEVKLEKHSHYKKDVLHLTTLDIYRVLELFEVRSHAVGHAVKKLLMAGNRGAKDYEQDIQEAIDSLNRELQMKQEDK